jgi:hypothetical protein
MSDISGSALPYLALPLGSGKYVYKRNGEAVAMEEVYEVAHREVTSRRTTPTGVTIEVVATAVEIAVTFSGSEVTISVLQQITDCIVSTRTVNGNVEASWVGPTEASLVASPLLRIFQGPAIKAVAARGDHGPDEEPTEVPVLLPWLSNPTDHARLLTADVQYRRAWRDPLAESYEGAPPYRYLGGNYEDSAQFWIDKNDVLQRYVWPQDPSIVWDVYHHAD